MIQRESRVGMAAGVGEDVSLGEAAPPHPPPRSYVPANGVEGKWITRATSELGRCRAVEALRQGRHG